MKKYVQLVTTHWRCVLSVCICMLTISLYGNAYAVDSICEYRDSEYAKYIRKLDELKEQEQNEVTLSKTIDLCNTMIQFLKKKEDVLVYTYKNAVKRYDRAEEISIEKHILSSMKQKLDDMSKAQEQIENEMNTFRAMILLLENNEPREIDEWLREGEKETLLYSTLKKLLARKLNLEDAGTNPDDLALVRREIDEVTNELILFQQRKEVPQDEIDALMEKLKDSVQEEYDMESKRIKDTEDNYKSRGDEYVLEHRSDVQPVDYPVANYKNLNIDSENKYIRKRKGRVVDVKRAGTLE